MKFFKVYKILFLFGRSIELHKFGKADLCQHEHDHECNFISIILKGSYKESINGKETVRKFLSTKYFKATDTHRIIEIINKPCWSLVFCGKSYRTSNCIVEVVPKNANDDAN